HPPYEGRVLLETQDIGRRRRRRQRWAQASVRVGASQRRLDDRLKAGRKGQSQPCLATAMHLQADRWLPAKQTPPPAALQALVQRLEHGYELLQRAVVAAIGDDAQADIAAFSPRRQARYGEADDRRAEENEQRRWREQHVGQGDVMRRHRDLIRP